MKTVINIQFEEVERAILAEAAHTLTAATKDTEEAEQARRRARGLANDHSPITRIRLQQVHDVYVAARHLLEQESEIDYWLAQVPPDERNREYASPTMGPEYMAKVLAEARAGQAHIVGDALQILDAALALATEVPEHTHA